MPSRTDSSLATSRRRRSLNPVLGGLGLRDFFDGVFTNDDVEHPKPQPQMVLAACAPDHVVDSVAELRALLVEDSAGG